MIDPFSETVISLVEAARMLPQRPTGKALHVAALRRWAARGIRGHKLEVIYIGGTVCTSREALARFFATISGNDEPGASPARPTAPGPAPRPRTSRSPAERAKASEAAARRLAELGV
ncbi:MAG: DUF1580 domain-containing protein [Isosphaeraceae bacterium]